MIHGFDCSHWDGTVEWPLVPQDYKFVFIKTTEGGWPADELAWQHWIGAGQEKKLRGAYHFWRYASPVSQATKFVDRVKWLEAEGPAELGLVWDAEDPRAPHGVGHKLAWHMNECLKIVDALRGKTTMMYSAKWWWDEWMANWKSLWLKAWPHDPLPDFSKRQLYVADYTAAPPQNPRRLPMDWNTWKFWQYADWAEIPGIAENDEDVDVFNGSLEELYLFAGMTPPPTLEQRVADLERRVAILEGE